MDWTSLRREDGSIAKVALEWNLQGKTEERVPHTELEENTHGRAENKKHHLDRMQENGKEQDKVESTSGRPMFHLGTKRTKRERRKATLS